MNWEHFFAAIVWVLLLVSVYPTVGGFVMAFEGVGKWYHWVIGIGSLAVFTLCFATICGMGWI